MRARIDVSEIEAQTKIRAKYLRALENEEWGLLPGPTFVKSFLRTYAQALGLDGKALVEEYRLHHERSNEAPLEPIVASSQHRQGRGRSAPSDGPSRAYIVAVGVIGVVIVVLVALLISGGGGTNTPSTSASKSATHSPSSTTHTSATHTHPAVPLTAQVALSLKANALVYVCLIGDDGRRLIPGVDVQPGESTHTYHAQHFELTLGNSSVTMYVDGIPRTVPSSANAIGYSITKAFGRRPLAPGHLPTCT
jgi:cytoskeleton protein RodZ